MGSPNKMHISQYVSLCWDNSWLQTKPLGHRFSQSPVTSESMPLQWCHKSSTKTDRFAQIKWSHSTISSFSHWAHAPKGSVRQTFVRSWASCLPPREILWDSLLLLNKVIRACTTDDGQSCSGNISTFTSCRIYDDRERAQLWVQPIWNCHTGHRHLYNLMTDAK